MNRLPNINVIEASESESDSDSDSLEDEYLDDQLTEFDEITCKQKVYQNIVTYQLMGYRSSSRKILSSTPFREESSISMKEFMTVLVSYQNMEKVVTSIKSDLDSLDLEYQSLNKKLERLDLEISKKEQICCLIF